MASQESARKCTNPKAPHHLGSAILQVFVAAWLFRVCARFHIRDSKLSDFRSEEHTSELQSLTNLVCRLLLEKKKKDNRILHVEIQRQQARRIAASAHNLRPVMAV